MDPAIKLDYDTDGNLIYRGVLVQKMNGRGTYKITKYEYSGTDLINIHSPQIADWENRTSLKWG